MAKKYMMTPVVVEAIVWDGSNREEVREFCDGDFYFGWVTSVDPDPSDMYILTSDHDRLKVSPGDYIVKHANGEYRPCKPDIFVQAYTEVK